MRSFVTNLKLNNNAIDQAQFVREEARKFCIFCEAGPDWTNEVGRQGRSPKAQDTRLSPNARCLVPKHYRKTRGRKITEDYGKKPKDYGRLREEAGKITEDYGKKPENDGRLEAGRLKNGRLRQEAGRLRKITGRSRKTTGRSRKKPEEAGRPREGEGGEGGGGQGGGGGGGGGRGRGKNPGQGTILQHSTKTRTRLHIQEHPQDTPAVPAEFCWADSRSATMPRNSTSHPCLGVRSVFQAFQPRANLKRVGCELRRLASDHDVADALQEVLSAWRWCIAYDPNFTAAQKIKKAGSQEDR